MYLKRTIFIAMLIVTQIVEAMSFAHHDWEVVCDNTNTCRIAGYSNQDAKLSLSVLLTRKAGAKQEVKGKLQLGSLRDEENAIFAKFPKNFKLEMKINNKSYGLVSVNKNDLIASLSKNQVLALLNSFKKSSKIIWKTGAYTWKLSDKGSSAVLLKVDEFQKRLSTSKNALASKVMPSISVPSLSTNKEITLPPKQMAQLEKKLVLDKEECFAAQDSTNKTTLYKLSSNKLLASKLCQMAAYNFSSAYWVINNKAPFEPKLITMNANEYSIENKVGTISGNHKGRGIGDCWSYESFVWNGQTFKLSSKGGTGDCRAIAAGGTWNLPIFVSKIKIK